MADVRTALVAKGIIEANNAAQVDNEAQRVLALAVCELPDELSCDRAVLRFAAVESVIRAAMTTVGGGNAPRAPKGKHLLSDRDSRVHDVVGAERFRTLRNAEIMRDPGIRKRLRVDFKLEPGGDDTKRCFDRIRDAKGYPLSSEIKKKRSKPQ